MHYFVRKFLEQEENQTQFNKYLSNPTNENKVAIQERFNDFCLRVKLLSYFSKSLPFFAQNFDKKNRSRNKQVVLTLSDLNGSDGLESVPDNTTIHMEASFDLEAVEQYFEHEELFQAIAKLTAQQKHIIYLFYVKELTDKDISKALNVSIQTINKQRNAILKKLKKEVSLVGYK